MNARVVMPERRRAQSTVASFMFFSEKWSLIVSKRTVASFMLIQQRERERESN